MGDYDEVDGYYSCLVHDFRSRSEFQGVLNKLRNTVIRTKYIDFVPRRVCVCEDRNRGVTDPDDPFDDITDTQLQESWNFVENHVLHKQESVFLRLQKYIEKLKDNNNPDEHKTSAHRFVHILRKALENDFSLLEPPPLLNDPNYQKAKDEIHRFAVPNFEKQYLGNLIGYGGGHIFPLQRKYKCHIAFSVQSSSNGSPGEQIFVTVTRKTAETEVFQRLEKRIKQHAETVQNKRKNHEKVRREYEEMKKAAEEQKKASADSGSTGMKGQSEEGAAGIAKPSSSADSVPGQKTPVAGTSRTCLTHHEAWASRLQYVLNQLQTENRLSNKLCKVFARAVCDCTNLRHLDIELPDCLKDAKEQAQKTSEELKKWKENQQILKPLINLLIANDGSEKNMSVLKFAYYFMKVISRDSNDLDKFENLMKEALKKRKQSQLQQPQMVDAIAEPSTYSPLTVSVTHQNTAVDGAAVLSGIRDQNPLDMVSMLDPASLVNSTLVAKDQDHTVTPGTDSIPSPTKVEKKEVDEDQGAKTKAQSKEEPCAEKEIMTCFVHDIRWFSLYQYTLNQMHKRDMLPRNKGVKFSSIICTCRMQDTQAQATGTEIDPSQQSSVIFEQRRRHVQIILEGWSRDEPKVFLPLFTAMEKLRQSEIYQSLVKFVFYFNELDNGNREFLEPANQGSASGPSQLQPAGTGLNQHSTESNLSQIPTAVGSENHSLADNQHVTASASYSVAAQSPSLTSPKSPQSPPMASPKAVHEDCIYHSRKWMNICQYMANNLYNEKLLEGRKRIEFFRKICFCDGQIDFSTLFKDRAEAKNCMASTRIVIGKWERAPHTMDQLFELFGKYEKGENISGGILKFLYYFKKSCDGEFKRSNM